MLRLLDPIPIFVDNPSPMTGAGNQTYLLVGSDRVATLIDAGVDDRRFRVALQERLDAHHAGLGQVLVTHAHADHASGAPALAAAHQGARFYKYPWPEEDARYAVRWEPLADGSRVTAADDALEVLHTAGHSPDHLAFWHDESRTAFTGDLVAAGTTVMIHTSRGGDLGRYLHALERLIALKPSRLLPAHGPPIDDPIALLTHYLDHRRARERQVVEALNGGLGTVHAIVESIYHGLAPALTPAAAENVLAHLEKLRREGRASEEDGRWKLEG
jgi:glyoxylase-like metal-dependent hydrolase (beta-lactamase superfamily II)